MKILTLLLPLVAAVKTDMDALYTWYQGIDSKNVVYAVSCGSYDAFTDVAGIYYHQD